MVWAAGITLFGYAFGRNLAFIDRTLSRFGLVMLGLLAGFLLGRLLYRRLRRPPAGPAVTGSPEEGPTG